VEQATLSYGYGLSVTAMQLVTAVAALADEGRLRKPSLVRGTNNPATSIMDPVYARQVAAMMETVTGPEGTGKKARVTNYRVSGKTGTSRKASAAGYASRYIATFVGFAPSSHPRLAAIVSIDDPSAGEYFGGLVAAPLFSTIMSGALRLMDIPPDDYTGALVQATAIESPIDDLVADPIENPEEIPGESPAESPADNPADMDGGVR
jgi:cell division protein FtsI (penicillin-binding protein 3)